MKLSLRYIKLIAKRICAFSLMLCIGVGAFYLVEWINQVPETYVVRAEIFDINKEDCSRPNPLQLIIDVDDRRNVFLSSEQVGSLGKTAILEKELLEIFNRREWNEVYREGTTQVEKQVIIRFDKSIKYTDVVALIETLNKIGANPVTLDLDKNYCECGGCGAGGGGNYK